MLTIMSIVCMYCRCDLGTKDGLGISGTTTGICPDCLREHNPEHADEILARNGGSR